MITKLITNKLIVAGSRTITNIEFVTGGISHFLWTYGGIELVVGGAAGVDTIAENWAKENNCEYVVFQALWKTYGKTAGIIRNEKMGNYADALLAFWDGKSRGTRHMINYMLDHGKPVHVEIYKPNE